MSTTKSDLGDSPRTNVSSISPRSDSSQESISRANSSSKPTSSVSSKHGRERQDDGKQKEASEQQPIGICIPTMCSALSSGAVTPRSYAPSKYTASPKSTRDMTPSSARSSKWKGSSASPSSSPKGEESTSSREIEPNSIESAKPSLTKNLESPQVEELSSTGTDRGLQVSTTNSTTTTLISLGEIKPPGGPNEESQSKHDNFSVDNLETILDGFEIFDKQEKLEIQKSFSSQAQDQALDVVEKVALIAQSSLKRLQQAVKEKDEVIITLQDEVGSAYRATLVQHEQDQKDLEQLHRMFTTRDDNSSSSSSLSTSLQRLELRNGLASQVAKLFDQYLHELTLQHEQAQSDALTKNDALWTSRLQELESNLEHEKQQWQSQLSKKLTANAHDLESTKDELDKSKKMVVALQQKLDEKDEELRVQSEAVETLEILMEEEKARETNLADDYERMTSDTRHTLSKVGVVNQQLRSLKRNTSDYFVQEHARDVEVKMLQAKLEHQNGMMHKLAVELGANRRKLLAKAAKGRDCKGCERLDETRNEVQLLRDCVPALVAQVLELKGRLSAAAKEKMLDEGEDSRLSRLKSDYRSPRSRNHYVERSRTDGEGREFAPWTDEADECRHEFVPWIAEDPHSDDAPDAALSPHCSHDFVPMTEGEHVPDPSSDGIRELEKTDHDQSDPRGFSEVGPQSNQGTSEGIVPASTYEQCLAEAASPRSLVTTALRLVEVETIKKLEGHGKITKRVELLKKRLESCKRAMEGTTQELRRAGATIERLKGELKGARETVRELEGRVPKRGAESKAPVPTDCVRIKGLLDDIEALEMERTLLKHDVMVQKGRQIARLERELRRAGPRTEVHAAGDEEAEGAIAAKDAQILELKFEAEQAAWKLGQVERRFQVLFGALDCGRMATGEPVADAVLEAVFSASGPEGAEGGDGTEEALRLVREKMLPRRGWARSGSREKELEELAEVLVKVVETLGRDNARLRRSCGDAVAQMEKTYLLRRQLADLRDRLAKAPPTFPRAAGGGGEQPVSRHDLLVSDLKSRMSNLAEANAGLLRTLRDTEDQCAGLRQMVQRQLSGESDKRRWEEQSSGPRSWPCCLSVADHEAQERRAEAQAGRITELEQSLADEARAATALRQRLARQEDELDLLHGRLSLAGPEHCEDLRQTGVDVWSAPSSTPARRHLRGPEAYEAKAEELPDGEEYAVEREQERVRAENMRLKQCVAALKNPAFLDELRDIKSEYLRMTKICDRYEELLRIYARQIGVPFRPLRVQQ